MRDDGDFGREPLHVLRLPLQIALGDQHGEIGVFDALRPKALIHLSLYILPDPIAVRANDHRSLDGAVVDELGLDDDVRIPLGKIRGDIRDLSDKLFLFHSDISNYKLN